MAEDHDPIPEGPERDDESAGNPMAEFLAQFGITPGPDGQIDMEELMGKLQGAMSQFQAQMASFGPSESGSGMNWTFTKDVARKVTASLGPDTTPTSRQVTQIRDSVGLSDLWLDQLVTFGRVNAAPAAWSRAEWVENTFQVWQQLIRPIVTSLSAALSDLLGRDAGAQGTEFIQPMLRAAASGMFSAQVGQSLGRLSAAVVSATDIGLPLNTTSQVALLPTNVAAFSDGLDLPETDVLLFLALRETARQRLFAAVGWLGPQLLALVEHYARDISIDASALEEAIEQQLNAAMTPQDIELAGQELAGKLFKPAVTEEQSEVLDRLETLLALVEGWVDDVVADTTRQFMPNATVLTEVVRRRRAAGGPAETALKSLIGLELRPRRTRDAANLWAATRDARGIEARDQAWSHPDLIPTAADLDDPLGFAERGHESAVPDDLDAELAKLLDEERGTD